MSDLFRLIWGALIGLLRSRAAWKPKSLFFDTSSMPAQNPKRVALSNLDRIMLVGFYRLAPRVLHALKIIKPETPTAGAPALTFCTSDGSASKLTMTLCPVARAKAGATSGTPGTTPMPARNGAAKWGTDPLTAISNFQ
jgi:hypothetical protein